ncbi:hypothetical protein DUI87_15727 [Hirundo rustica rustica]|uniref:Uncharacterized protein n=1 Tax=Hirundo rustica rustica TaxID=333673 RepID=A0A3M0JZA9_HIRRU|nr:hypothetical protein DUI87_15727 [Hirundo rustica rustica]
MWVCCWSEGPWKLKSAYSILMKTKGSAKSWTRGGITPNTSTTPGTSSGGGMTSWEAASPAEDVPEDAWLDKRQQCDLAAKPNSTSGFTGWSSTCRSREMILPLCSASNRVMDILE